MLNEKNFITIILGVWGMIRQDKVLKDIRALLDFELFEVSKITLNFDLPKVNKTTINLELPKVSKNDHQSGLVQS